MTNDGTTGSEAQGPTPQTPADTARQMASSTADTVKQEAAHFASAAQDKAEQKIETQKQTATQALTEFAAAIRTAGGQLSQTDHSMAGRMVKQAADGLEGFSRSVADKPPQALLEAVRDFGRQNPTAFIAGSVLAGLALGRFLRASDKPRASDTEGEADPHFPVNSPVNSMEAPVAPTIGPEI